MHRPIPRVLGALLSMLALAITLGTGTLMAQSADSIAGRWSGEITLPNGPLDITVILRRQGDAWQGTIDIPQQRAKDLPLKNMIIAPPSVSFGIVGIPGKPIFTGSIEPGGTRISGSFVQAGVSLPFHLTRAGASTGGASTAGGSSMSADSLAAAIADLRAAIPKALDDWKVPGLAIAIVRKDTVLLAEGFGYRDLEKKLPVTPSTLFAIGSSTKAFTTLLLGTLVDEEKISWTTPVVEYMPGFHLKDPYATSHMTPRDLVTHVSGLPRHDAMWYGSGLTRRQIFDRLQYLEPTAELRTKWQYQNLMYMTAGMLAEQVTGQSWEDLVRLRIFEPLGMRSSNLSVTDMRAAAEASLGYGEDTTEKLLPYRNIDQIGPAGSINSTILDMARWARFHLGDGTFEGKRIVDQATLDQLHTGQVVIDGGKPTKDRIFRLYAMGWMVEAFKGHRLLQHGGNIDGFTAMVSFLPEDDLGVVVLSNQNGTPLPATLMYSAYDRLLGINPDGWSERLKGRVKNQSNEEEEDQKKPEDLGRVPNTRPSHPLKAYVGEYEHPAYGLMTIELDHDRLKATYNGISTPLEHYHYDLFKGTEVQTLLGDERVQFLTSVDGDIDQLSINLEPTTENIVFTRRVPAALSDTNNLRRFAGNYDLSGLRLVISLEHGKLFAQATGQGKHQLVPLRDNTFQTGDLRGFRIRFEEEKGKVVRLVSIQPNGSFAGKRVE